METQKLFIAAALFLTTTASYQAKADFRLALKDSTSCTVQTVNDVSPRVLPRVNLSFARMEDRIIVFQDIPGSLAAESADYDNYSYKKDSFKIDQEQISHDETIHYGSSHNHAVFVLKDNILTMTSESYDFSPGDNPTTARRVRCTLPHGSDSSKIADFLKKNM